MGALHGRILPLIYPGAIAPSKVSFIGSEEMIGRGSVLTGSCPCPLYAAGRAVQQRTAKGPYELVILGGCSSLKVTCDPPAFSYLFW